MLRSHAIRSKGAVDGPRGAEDEAEPAGYARGSYNAGPPCVLIGEPKGEKK